MTFTPLFELDRISYSRAGQLVLDDVTTALPGPVTGVVGPSGSGKSTLLRLLCRLADPERGTISYRGAELHTYDVLDLRRRVCLVPQLPALVEGTVAANVAFGPQLAGGSLSMDRIDELLGLAGLDGSFAGRDADRLSVGEQQRVMLARALALEPEVLLLDEPTAALDVDARTAVERTIMGLTECLDVALIVVTHDPDQARRLSRTLVRMSEGRVVATGGAEEVLSR